MLFSTEELLVTAGVILIIILLAFLWQVVQGNKAVTSKYSGFMHNLTEDHQYVMNPSTNPV